MSYPGSNGIYNPGGHVPVGTGQQIPVVHRAPQSYAVVGPTHTVVVATPGSHGPSAVTVYRDGGEPARQVPPTARRHMEARARYTPPQTPTVVHIMHQPDLQHPSRSNHVVNTTRNRQY
jgi:hypothetical protein